MFDLLASPTHTPARSTTGHWCMVRMCLDIATEEWLNVGILFVGSDGAKCYRLLENFSGVTCLYDEDAASAARFLLDQTAHALETGSSIPKGWNVELGALKFARGTSPEAIVNSLFARLVPLARHEQDSANRLDREDHAHATKNVRAKVRGLINRHLNLAKSATPEFWRKQPLPAQRDGASIQIDLQVVWALDGKAVHGAIASAWYKTRYHRTASLSQAGYALTTACKAFPQSLNTLYLLAPPSGDSRLSPDDHTAIEQDIATNKWALEQQGAVVKIERTESQMASSILRDLRLLNAVS